MKTKVALVNVGFEAGEPSVQRSPPFGILYIGAFLRKHSLDVRLFDWSGESLSDQERTALEEFDPDIVGFTVLISSSILRAMKVSKWAKDLGAIVVWGGPGPTSLPELTLRDAPVDFVVIGEGEGTMLDLCGSIDSGISPDEVKGIAFRRDGDLIVTPPRPRIRDLDALPMPLWDSIGDLGRFLVPFHGRMAMPMNTSRGCPASCSFCYTKKMWGHKWTSISAGRILEEIQHVQSIEPRMNGVIFDDDLFAGSVDRMREFCETVIERNVDILWNCELRADQIEEGLLRIMKEAGCRQILVGIESGSQRLLDIVLKKTKVEDMKRAFDIIRKTGLEGDALLMVGLPGETEDDFRQTEELLSRLKAYHYEFKVYMPYPGTQLLEVAKEHGFIQPQSLEEWAERSEVHKSTIAERNLSSVPTARVKRLIDKMERRTRNARYWDAFKSDPITAPTRAIRFLRKSKSGQS
ncbi:MAG: B12-binding domain-containing radical SAM protein [Methanomassiliicoccales archaeon]|nr:B12-binding domain-containing radical SAM protein [Methanomassiliicoccales archaeon]